MTLTHVAAIRTELADLVVGHVNDGSAGGKIRIWATSVGGTLLCEIVLDDPAFAAAVAGVASANGLPKEGTATASGTAAFFDMVDSNNAEVFRGTVTATAGGGDIELSTTTIAISDVIRLNVLTYTAGP